MHIMMNAFYIMTMLYVPSLPNDAPPWIYQENTVNLIGATFLAFTAVALLVVLSLTGYTLLVPRHREQLKLEIKERKRHHGKSMR